MGNVVVSDVGGTKRVQYRWSEWDDTQKKDALIRSRQVHRKSSLDDKLRSDSCTKLENGFLGNRNVDKADSGTDMVYTKII